IGLEVVEVILRRQGRRSRIRIDIDRPGPGGVAIEDCRTVSRTIEGLLDDSDLIPGSYVLEVSSPGLDRPIRTDDDVRRNTGRRVVVTTREPVEGRTTFRGVLLGIDGNDLRLREDDAGEIAISRDGVAAAHQEIAFQ
ncbi:MAG: ribosome maturation factor RimP, partial [Acidobacteriota bacterium]|nr:ribosome maturation factor RimP [Acidobacteriota bacterium]